MQHWAARHSQCQLRKMGSNFLEIRQLLCSPVAANDGQVTIFPVAENHIADVVMMLSRPYRSSRLVAFAMTSIALSAPPFAVLCVMFVPLRAKGGTYGHGFQG